MRFFGFIVGGNSVETASFFVNRSLTSRMLLLGLPLLLLDYMLETARRKPEFQWVEGSWVLEDNVAIDELIEDFSGRITKRYRIYRREIAAEAPDTDGAAV